MIFFFPPFVLVIVYVIVAAYYRERLRKKYLNDVGKYNSLQNIDMRATDFDSGLFDCFNGPKSARKCCFSCFCAPVRWSTDASATGFMDFWIALFLSSIFISFMFIFGFVGRIHIRASSGMERKPISDFFSWLCCYPCVLTQEAKFIDKGFRAIRDGVQTIQLESQPPVASVIQKRPETPGTTAPPTPERPVVTERVVVE